MQDWQRFKQLEREKKVKRLMLIGKADIDKKELNSQGSFDVSKILVANK
jgi:hypothetical protein